MTGEICFFFICAVYNQIQRKLQMSDNHTWHSMCGETVVPAADAAADAARVKAYDARVTADAAARANTGTADTIAENAIRHQPYMAIPCKSCRLMANTVNNPNYKCQACKLKPQGGSKRKSKSHRRKKSKYQRRKKSMKRRH